MASRAKFSLDDVRRIERFIRTLFASVEQHDEFLLDLAHRMKDSGALDPDYVPRHAPGDRIGMWTLVLAKGIWDGREAFEKDLPFAKRETPIALDPERVKASVQDLFKDIKREL